MTDNAVNKSITFEIPEDKEELPPEQNNFPLAIQELGEGLFEKYPDKTSDLSDENIRGIIRCRALNDFMQEKYGVRYTVLDKIVEDKMNLNLSKSGKGIEKFIDIVKSVQASFQDLTVPMGMMGRMGGQNRR
jgi:hypothetical protein